MTLSERSQLLGGPAQTGLTAKFTHFFKSITWSHTVWAVAVVTFVGLMALALSPKGGDNPVLMSTAETSSALKMVMDAGQVSQEGYTWTSSASGKHLLIQKPELDASELSLILTEDVTQDLISIDIRLTESLIGNFSRIYTPKLKDFRFNFTRPGADIEDNGSDSFRVPDALQAVIFFELEKSPDYPATSSWSLKKDIADLGVTIAVTIHGTKVITIDRAVGLIELNLDYAWELLENTKGSYEKLVLLSCPWAGAPNDPQALTFPPTLKYLNLWNITNMMKPGPVKFDTFFRPANIGGLESLIIYEYAWGFPSLQTSLNLADLPSQGLTKITFRGLDLKLNSRNFISDESVTAFKMPVKDLTLEANEYDPTIVENFPTIFQNVKTLRLFDLKSDSDEILYKAATSLPSLYRIAVMDLDRTGTSPRTNQVLTSFGLSPAAKDFELVRDYSGYGAAFANKNNGTATPPAPVFIAKELSNDERHRERYDALGFPDFETYVHYFSKL